MRKFIVFNKKREKFSVLSTIVEMDNAHGMGVGKMVKDSPSAITIDDNIMEYLEMPKDGRGGNRGNGFKKQ